MTTKIRASLLPKLEACRSYTSEETTSEAAGRGTRIHEAIASALNGNTPDGLPEDEARAVAFAVQFAQTIGRRWQIEPQIKHPSIAGWKLESARPDLVIEDADGRLHIVDWKTGEIRDYSLQLAAYAVLIAEAEMHEFVEVYVHTVFVDKEVIVNDIVNVMAAKQDIARVLMRPAEPTPCDYCGWCAARNSCPARTSLVETVQEAASVELLRPTFDQILADPDLLGKFLDGCAVVEDMQEQAKAKAREHIANGQRVAGWRLGKARTTDTVTAASIELVAASVGIEKIVQAYGAMSKKKWDALGIDCPVQIESKTGEPTLMKEKIR